MQAELVTVQKQRIVRRERRSLVLGWRSMLAALRRRDGISSRMNLARKAGVDGKVAPTIDRGPRAGYSKAEMVFGCDSAAGFGSA